MNLDEAEMDEPLSALPARERTFPILQPTSGPGRIRSVPWAMVEPHRALIEDNHCGQTLERLAERGGLSPWELIVALDGKRLRDVRDYPPRGDETAETDLIVRVAGWKERQALEGGKA